jgi:hypothetical protein
MLILGSDSRLPADHPDQPAQWSDYRLTVTVRTADDDGGIGVVFRYRDADNYYRYSMNRQRNFRRLVSVSGGTFTLLAEDEIAYELNRDYLTTVEVSGPSIRVYEDGTKVFEVTDDTIAQGSIGLYTYAYPGVHFSDIRVDDLRLTAPVYSFQFTTSKYANFFHHMHSFQDETWPVVLADALREPSATVRLNETAMPPGEDEVRSYESLAASVPGFSPHQLPAQVEISRLLPAGSDPASAEPALAFLVQSPEPIDWTRVELRLESTRLWSPKPGLPGIVKLTHASFAGATAGEGVSLLLREACDLTGWWVEHRRLVVSESGPTGTSADWLLYYAFDDEERLPAGTQIELVEESASAEAGLAAGVQRRYVTAPGHSLASGGTELRVVTPNGQVVHQRHFVSADAYRPISARMVRKVDGTGFFILPAAIGATFDPKQHRLHMTFHRKSDGEEDESRKLSQAGHSEPEEVVIHITK